MTFGRDAAVNAIKVYTDKGYLLHQSWDDLLYSMDIYEDSPETYRIGSIKHFVKKETIEIPYTVPDLFEHTAGSPGEHWSGYIWLRPGMDVRVRHGSFIDAIFIDHDWYGGRGASKEGGFAVPVQCDDAITTIGGMCGSVINSLYVGITGCTGPRGSATFGGTGGTEQYLFNRHTVGRIYAIGFFTGKFPAGNVEQLVTGIRILSTA
eukprot:TRINITY_DN16659_c0_g1_i1.p1 TRINITY_DN16659_c0_g1~~TRINITY_DN16659_c0_g1_i1.p1  ORF type:complete len:207 (-),score=19.83 TRINITY_DN16659_c0_g1_i1:319-939(-)